MKKIVSLCLAGTSLLAAHQISAQSISIAASPGSQTVAGGSSFNVSLTLSVPQGSGPTNVAAFDLYLVTALANSGYFKITAANPTGPFNAFGPNNPNGDPLSTGAASGYVRNNIDQGFSGSTQTAPFSNLALETLTLQVAANTPQRTYSFQTSTTQTAGVQYSDVSDNTGNVFEVTSPGTFSITVVPEPSAWTMVGLTFLGGLGFAVRQRRRPAC